ncbi:hypothetical protein [Aureimonas sp. SK2]|uniref:hypothetical protein n=1 Tax=Aureimonas sp. SK2 TaxID=3015992 RepID=UPI002443A7EF|nr:hypothetical protein [Aureimonas sp. SK2]
MHTRSALFEGSIRPGCEEAFFDLVMAELMPVWQAMPNALDMRVLRMERREEGAPALVLVQEIDYPSLEAVTEAEASPVRARGAPIMARLMTLFDGTLRHVVYRRLA